MSQTPSNEPLPAPLTPPDCDLRGFPWMELHIERLRRSRAWALGRRHPELNLTHHNMALWTTAYYEVPAASLEDDDDALADAAECTPERWPKVKKLVMRGWIKCADGRLYHTTLAEIAREAWRRKLTQRAKSRAGGRARWAGKAASDPPDDAPDKARGKRQAVPEAKPQAVPQAVPEAKPEQSLKMPQYKDIDIDIDKDRDSTSPTPSIPYEQDSSETGTTGREAFSAASALTAPATECAADAAPAGRATVATSSDKPSRDAAKPAGDRPRHTAGQGSRLPEGWAPKPPDWQRALTLGLDPSAVLESFCDYWHAQPGAKGRKADWDATWRTWCRREVERQRQRPSERAKPPPKANSLEAYVAAFGHQAVFGETAPATSADDGALVLDGELVP